MSINFHNYEIYFIDYYDGKLNSDEIAALMYFLNKNPDIKEEFEAYNNTILDPVNIAYPDKKNLKKFDLTQEINSSNFEEFCIANLEGNLAADKQNELTNFLKKNTNYKKDAEIIANTKLSPNLNIIFPYKHRLKKGTLLRINLYRTSYAIAASILLFLLINIIWKDKQQTNNNISEKSNTIQNINEEKPLVKTIENKPVTTQTNNSKKNNPNIILQKETKEITNLSINKETNLAQVNINQISIPERLQRIEPNKINISIPNPEFNTSELLAKYHTNYFEANQQRSKPVIISIKKPTLYNIADAGIKGINKILGTKMSLEKIDSEDENSTTLAFNSKLISFSKTIEK